MSDAGLTMLSEGQQTGRLSYSEVLGDISSHLSYLPEVQSQEVIQLLLSPDCLWTCPPVQPFWSMIIKQHAY